MKQMDKNEKIIEALEKHPSDLQIMAQAYTIAASTPVIYISCSEYGNWLVEVKEIGLSLRDGSSKGLGLLLLVKSAKAAYDTFIATEREFGLDFSEE